MSIQTTSPHVPAPRLPSSTLRRLAEQHGTPLFVYDSASLADRAKQLQALQLPYGLTVRYAMKANNHPKVLALYASLGLQFDASSSYEAMELLEQGIPGHVISLSSQQPAHNLRELLRAGVHYVATSLHQLALYAASPQRPGRVGLRVNPGLGAGHNNRNMTGGANSSFGLWNAYVPDALRLAQAEGLTIDRLHVHAGSGADPDMWGTMLQTALAIAHDMPDVTVLDMGGGYKIHRYGDEQEANMHTIASQFARGLRSFAEHTGRHLRLEIEPGTWLVGHGVVLVATIVDIVDTGADGHTFLRLNTGMNDIIRPSMYGAQHSIAVLNDAADEQDYVVVGHNCETGDILTPAIGDPESTAPRTLRRAAVGDVVAIYDAGAYCRNFSVTGYNSFPPAGEVWV